MAISVEIKNIEPMSVGADGAKLIQGPPGPRGERGERGETGADGVGIASAELISGTHAAGTSDTYRITYTDGKSFDFTVYNGADGETAQADWNQNDETKAGYVKNRTHYDSRKETVITKTVEMADATEGARCKIAEVDEIDFDKVTAIAISTTQYEDGSVADSYDSGKMTGIDILDVSGDTLPAGNVIRIVCYDPENKNDTMISFLLFKTADAASAAGVGQPGLYPAAPISAGRNFTFTFYFGSGELKTLDPKYIKDMYYTIPPVVDIKGYTITLPSWSTSESEHDEIPFALGQVWSTNYSGYSELPVQQAGDGTLYIGTYPDVNNTPFYITSTKMKPNSSWLSNANPGICILTGIDSGEQCNKILEKYLPDTAFFQNHAPISYGTDADGNIIKTATIQGYSTTASGNYSHAEGASTTASGSGSHAEGANTKASGTASHAEGDSTTASGNYSHAEGASTTASGSGSHAEGYNTTASGNYSHAEGQGTVANSRSTHVEGEFNAIPTSAVADKRSGYAHIVGNGTSNTARSNAHTLDWDGNAWFAGHVSVGKWPNEKQLATVEEVNAKYTKPDDGIPKSDLASDVQTSLTDAVKSASGTYTGTGTYGADNPCSLTFDFEPKIVIMLGYLEPNVGWQPLFGGSTGSSQALSTVMTADALSTTYSARTGFLKGNSYSTFNTIKGKKSEDGKTFYWYDTESDSGQCNSEGYTYYYLAIG